MRRARLAVLLLLLATSCRHARDAPHTAQPSPSASYTTFGPVKLPMPTGWLISKTPQRPGTLQVEGADTRTSDGRLKTGVTVIGSECHGPSGQVTRGTVAGHPVHLGRYSEESTYEWVIHFDDVPYCLLALLRTDHTIVSRDLERLDQVMHTLTAA